MEKIYDTNPMTEFMRLFGSGTNEADHLLQNPQMQPYTGNPNCGSTESASATSGDEAETQLATDVDATKQEVNFAHDLGNRILAQQASNRVWNHFSVKSAMVKTIEVQPGQVEEVFPEQIVNTNRGLCVLDSARRAHLIWQCGIQYVTRYEPDLFFGISPWYQIWINESPYSFVISDVEINKGKSLKQMLSIATGIEIIKYKSEKRTNELLRSFLQMSASVYTIPLHYGWMPFEGAWKFVLQDNKTHNLKQPQYGNVRVVTDDHDGIRRFNSYPIKLRALSHVDSMLEILNLFIDPWIRKKIWLYVHVAPVFSLLKYCDIKFDSGLYIQSESLRVRKFLEEIFEWHGDRAIRLSDAKENLVDKLILSKDQSLVILDENSDSVNDAYIKEVLLSGQVKHSLKGNMVHYQLLALPVILSDGKSRVKACDRLNHLVVNECDVTENAIERFRDLKESFHEYLEYFLYKVSCDKYFIPTIQRNIEQAYEDAPQHLELRRDVVETIGILMGVQERLMAYYQPLNIQKDSPIIQEYMDMIQTDDYPMLYQQELNSEDNSEVYKRFLLCARKLIAEGTIEVRYKEEGVFYYQEDNLVRPVILMDYDYAYIPGLAFERICNACEVGRRTMAKALRDSNLLYGATKSNGTVEGRVLVHFDSGDKKQQYVYKIDVWHLKSSTEEETIADGPYKLKLGVDSHGCKRTWSGGINSHIRITGCSGTGKSYLLRYLAGQLPAQGVKCIILDSSGDFSNPRGRQPEGWPVEGARIVNMREDPIELISFAPKDDEETIADIISRISTTISVALGFGKRQTGHLTERISYGLQSGKLKEFKDLKELLNTHGRGSQSANSVYSAMDGLWDVFPTGAKSFDWEFDKAGITIINLHEAYGENAEKIVVEMLLGELSSKRMRNSMTDMPPLVLIMDECQRLCWNENSFASKLMKESRKYGISIWAGTQSLGKKTISNALGQCGLQLAFKPDADGVSSLSKELTDFNKALFSKCSMRMRSLERGQFLYVKNGEIIVASAP